MNLIEKFQNVLAVPIVDLRLRGNNLKKCTLIKYDLETPESEPFLETELAFNNEETITGDITIEPENGSKLCYRSVELHLMGVLQTENFERVFLDNFVVLQGSYELSESIALPFSIKTTGCIYDSFLGKLFMIKYFLKVVILRDGFSRETEVNFDIYVFLNRSVFSFSEENSDKHLESEKQLHPCRVDFAVPKPNRENSIVFDNCFTGKLVMNQELLVRLFLNKKRYLVGEIIHGRLEFEQVLIPFEFGEISICRTETLERNKEIAESVVFKKEIFKGTPFIGDICRFSINTALFTKFLGNSYNIMCGEAKVFYTLQLFLCDRGKRKLFKDFLIEFIDYKNIEHISKS